MSYANNNLINSYTMPNDSKQIVYQEIARPMTDETTGYQIIGNDIWFG